MPPAQPGAFLLYFLHRDGQLHRALRHKRGNGISAVRPALQQQLRLPPVFAYGLLAAWGILPNMMEEYKRTRAILLRNLQGSSAFRNGGKPCQTETEERP